jgi:LEA14-like dessication related protein
MISFNFKGFFSANSNDNLETKKFQRLITAAFLCIFIATAITSLTGCDTEQINPWHTGAVKGKVTDLSGTPVPNAKVYLPDFFEHTVTDEKGMFYLNEIPVGTNTVMAERQGYTNDAKSIIIEGNKTIENMDFKLVYLPVWAQEKNITTQDFLNKYSN